MKAAFEKHKWVVDVADTKAAALELVAKAIPNGASVGQAGSTSLHELGWSDFCKAHPDKWNNLHAKKLAESDPAKQAAINELGADYFVSSVSAVTEDGELLACDLTGSRVGAFPSTAGHLVIVVGAQKLVKNLAEAHQRQNEFCLPVESARVRVVYKVPASRINNLVELRGANPWGAPGRVHLIICKEAIGF